MLTALVSCEKVIDVDLSSVEPQIVIDGTITDQPGPYTVKISKTGDYFNPGAFPAVTGASVTISDNRGYRRNLPDLFNTRNTGKEIFTSSHFRRRRIYCHINNAGSY